MARAGRNTQKHATAAQLALQTIASLGHATAAQLAPIAYPSQAPASARISAHRLVRKLVHDKLLLRRTDGIGRTRYVLTAAGTRACDETWAKPGYDLRMHTAYRMDTLNNLLTKNCNPGEIPWGAALVRTGVLPGVPKDVDGVVQTEDGRLLGLCARDVHCEAKSGQQINSVGGTANSTKGPRGA